MQLLQQHMFYSNTKVLFGGVPLFSNCKLRVLSNSYLRFHSEASACAEAFPSAACLSAFATANKWKRKIFVSYSVANSKHRQISNHSKSRSYFSKPRQTQSDGHQSREELAVE